MVVPHGCDAVRTFNITHLRVRVLGWGSAFLVALLWVSGLALGRFSSRQGVEQRLVSERLVNLQARLDSLSDTLQVIGKRNDQIRVLAGLPGDSLVARTSGEAHKPALELTPAPRTGTGSLISRLSASAAADVDRLIARANGLAASFTKVSEVLASNVERSARIPSIMPTAGWLSSNFSLSRFHPILHANRPHEGIDLAAPMGAPIVAPAAGTVTRVDRQAGYGLVVELDHGYGIVTKYAHCSRASVRVGQHVKRGDEIGAVGNSGLSTGPHLHYEIHVNGKLVNPLTYMLPQGAIPE